MIETEAAASKKIQMAVLKEPSIISVASTRPFCRICRDASGDLISPCQCKGTTGFVHLECLQEWLMSSACQSPGKCEVCKQSYRFNASRCKSCMYSTKHFFSSREFIVTFLLVLLFGGTIAIVLSVSLIPPK